MGAHFRMQRLLEKAKILGRARILLYNEEVRRLHAFAENLF
jgi:hypothetical protein